MSDSSDVGAVSVGYQLAGSSAGRPVLLLPGLGDSGPDWMPVLVELATTV